MKKKQQLALNDMYQERNRTEQKRICITLKLLQLLGTLHTYTTIYNFGDKTGHNNNG